MADIQLTFGAEETISTELDKATKATDKLTKSITAEEKAATGAGKATVNWAEAVTAANQALEIAGKVWDVAARSAAAFAGYVKDGALEAMAAERAQRMLSAALGTGAERISEVTAALQRKTGADADALNKQAAALAAYGLTTDQIERAIPAMHAFSEVTGKEASRAITALGKAAEEGKADEYIARLAQFIPAADAAAETFSGSVARLTTNVGEFQEEIGSSVVESAKLQASLDVLNQTVLEVTGSVEGIGPLLGDGLAKGLELSAEAAALTTRALRELLEPTSALSGVVTGLLPNIGTFRTGLNLLASDTMANAGPGLDALADKIDGVASALGRANEATVDAKGADIDATLAVWRAKIASDDEKAAAKAEETKAKQREEAGKAARKAAEDDQKSIRKMEQSLAERYEKERISGISAGLAEQSRLMEEEQKEMARSMAEGIKDEEKAAADKRKRMQKWFDEQQKILSTDAKQAKDAAKQAQQNTLDIIGDVGSYASAGASAMSAFAAGMAAESTSDKIKGILTGVLQVVGGVLGGVAAGPAGIMAGAGAGGAVGSLFSSMPFREGGAAQGYEIPKARRGAMVLGDTDTDGRIIEAHSGEVILTAGAVARNGGQHAVARQNDPRTPPMNGRGGGAGTVINVVALDPMTAVQVIERSVEPAQVQRMQGKQGAKWRREIAKIARGPRNGGSR